MKTVRSRRLANNGNGAGIVAQRPDDSLDYYRAADKPRPARMYDAYPGEKDSYPLRSLGLVTGARWVMPGT